MIIIFKNNTQINYQLINNKWAVIVIKNNQ